MFQPFSFSNKAFTVSKTDLSVYHVHITVFKCFQHGQVMHFLVVKRVNFTTQSRLLMTLWKNPFENIVGKGENAGNQHFLLFPTMFSTLSFREIIILAKFKLPSGNTFNLGQFKILSFGREFIGSKKYCLGEISICQNCYKNFQLWNASKMQ